MRRRVGHHFTRPFMAKHPVPKRRQTSARSSRRHSVFFKSVLKKLNNAANIVVCAKCGGPRLSHTACPACGEYRGRTVITQKVTKVEKVKA